jgi:UPF0755 protein
MIDFGFDKIALIGAVALIVIGPEKLPKVARTVGHLFGKAQRYVADVRAEVNRSIETLREASDAEIMARLGRPAEHPEGRFFPDTYHFPAGLTDEAFLHRALIAMDRRLNQAWGQRSPQLPLSDPYQALILASIVEKETGLAAERAAIAGVFTRRLQQGMLLQTDPTVIYGLGDAFDGNLSKQDLTTDTTYNTYTRKGLPPTPIALPGAAALAAAVNPASGDALYFVANGEGGHIFSRTLNEHNQAVRLYQQRVK